MYNTCVILVQYDYVGHVYTCSIIHMYKSTFICDTDRNNNIYNMNSTRNFSSMYAYAGIIIIIALF